MIAILADIHGNFAALKAVLEEIDKTSCQKIISLGDVAGYYADINECIDLLKERDVVNLMGNHDEYLLIDDVCPRSTAANDCLIYQKKVIREDNKAWLAKSVRSYEEGDVSMVHGGWKDPIDEYVDNVSEAYFDGLPHKYFFSGHTHVQVSVKLGDKHYCNPGSVGQPRDGDPKAAFALFDGRNIELKRVAYDLEATAKSMERAGFNAYYYENLYEGVRIGGKRSFVKIPEVSR